MGTADRGRRDRRMFHTSGRAVSYRPCLEAGFDRLWCLAAVAPLWGVQFGFMGFNSVRGHLGWFTGCDRSLRTAGQQQEAAAVLSDE
jgi:hypothetical protein